MKSLKSCRPTKPFLEKVRGRLRFECFERMNSVECTSTLQRYFILLLSLFGCLFLRQDCTKAQASLKFTMQLRTILKLDSSSLCLLSAGVIGMQGHSSHWVYVVLGEEPKAPQVLGKCSTHRAYRLPTAVGLWLMVVFLLFLCFSS